MVPSYQVSTVIIPQVSRGTHLHDRCGRLYASGQEQQDFFPEEFTGDNVSADATTHTTQFKNNNGIYLTDTKQTTTWGYQPYCPKESYMTITGVQKAYYGVVFALSTISRVCA